MLNTTKVFELLDAKAKVDVNDDITTQEYWDALTDELSGDEYETIKFLKGLDNDKLEQVSEIFSDLSQRFKSQTFISGLNDVFDSHPTADIGQEIKWAEEEL
ncbi:MAG: hypothetical protein LBT80_01755 [Lactobacillaceae bacterium]|jgi:hypothetical protein|nr:hypothetical protein [Lactobacillaceae bacterium]